MMIYGIIITILLLCISGLAFYAYKIKKLNIILTSEIVKDKQKPILIGHIVKYSVKELDILLRNPDVIDILLKVYAYKIAMKTDSIRSLENIEEKVGYLNCLHEMHLFFHQQKQKLNKKEEKAGQSLV